MNCGLCKGNLTPRKVNHTVDLKEGIIIKDVPAEVCKQCGEYYVDTQIALTLESIVDEVRRNPEGII